jgi:8-oxo-dGTP pyrophosphatase MutT (NUDIX family)
MQGTSFADRVRQILASRKPIRARGDSLHEASVLLPFFSRSDDGSSIDRGVHLWLVRRADGMRVHGGQVALPGGKREPDDEDLLSTALRETHEEIGLSPNDVDVLGALDDCVTVTGFAVTPYVGWITKPFAPQPLASEVARVFAAPLSAFEVPPRAMSIDLGESKRIVLSYEATGEIVWGATASILRNFVDLVQ